MIVFFLIVVVVVVVVVPSSPLGILDSELPIPVNERANLRLVGMRIVSRRDVVRVFVYDDYDYVVDLGVPVPVLPEGSSDGARTVPGREGCG